MDRFRNSPIRSSLAYRGANGDSPSVRGLVNQVSYLVRIEEQ